MKFVSFIVLSFLFLSCAKKKDKTVATPALSEEAQALTTASANLGAVGEGDTGVLQGAPTTIGSLFQQLATAQAPSNYIQNKAFNPETDCNDSGGVSQEHTQQDAGWPIAAIYCNLVRRPDGPDTVRGAIDRTAGWMCALGNIIYDGVPREVDLKITTRCFSTNFTTMVLEELGTDTVTATVTGYNSVAGIGPASFDKYLTFESDVKTYTILVKQSANERAIAVRDGLPGTATGAAFSVYMNKATGVMKVEGRFAPSTGENCDDVNCRHIRFHMTGELSDNFEIENVQGLHFLGGEPWYYTSLSGTPAAGRRLRFRGTGNNYSSNQSASTDDEDCYGEAGATCSGNNGILIADVSGTGAPYLFNGTRDTHWKSSEVWFSTHSYLGSTGNLTVDPDADIWP